MGRGEVLGGGERDELRGGQRAGRLTEVELAFQFGQFGLRRGAGREFDGLHGSFAERQADGDDGIHRQGLIEGRARLGVGGGGALGAELIEESLCFRRSDRETAGGVDHFLHGLDAGDGGHLLRGRRSLARGRLGRGLGGGLGRVRREGRGGEQQKGQGKFHEEGSRGLDRPRPAQHGRVEPIGLGVTDEAGAVGLELKRTT